MTDTDTSPPVAAPPATARTSPPSPLPGPRGLEVVRAAVDLKRDPLTALRRAAARWGDAVSLPIPPWRLVLLNHPDHVAHVLQAGAARYGRSPNYAELEPVIGKGLLTNDGASWRRQRRIAQPMFHRRPLVAQLGPIVRRATDDMLADWRARGDAVFDVVRDTHRLALRVAGLSLFSRDLGGQADQLARALAVALPFVQRRTESIVRPPLWLPTPSHVRFHLARRALDGIVQGLIDERRRAHEQAPDLLGRLLDARDPESGAAMTDRQLRDEVMTFLLAGHETSANALAWALHELSRHPEVARRLAAELDHVVGARPVTVDDLPRLGLVTRVVKEALRLHPPAWVIERLALEDDVVQGHRIPRGSIVLLCAWTTHRHAAFWPEPDRFDPDRWADGVPKARLAYFPFGGGQRQCIGEEFARLELELAVARVAQVARLEPAPGHRVRPCPGVTLRPDRVLVRAR
ncbi:MAG: cytochrome P450 [Planctomycetes bacterium]|nr:cytochrome P450 [Planctomycetota bacterium]